MIMRFALIIAACALSTAAMAQSNWSEFRNPDLGFVVSFPQQPVMDRMTVRAVNGNEADETLYSVRQDDAVFSVAVIEFEDGAVNGDAEIDRAIARLRAEGQVVVDVSAWVNGSNGRQISIAGRDGSHSTVGIFFGNNRLYEVKGTLLASNPDPMSGELIRFQQSLSFTARPDEPPAGFQRRRLRRQ